MTATHGEAESEPGTRFVFVLEYRLPDGLQDDDFQRIAEAASSWDQPETVGAVKVAIHAAVADAADAVVAMFEPGERP